MSRFVGGEMNTCYNAVDRHVISGHGDQLALIYDSPVTDTIEKYTYQELLDQVTITELDNVIFLFNCVTIRYAAPLRVCVYPAQDFPLRGGGGGRGYTSQNFPVGSYDVTKFSRVHYDVIIVKRAKGLDEILLEVIFPEGEIPKK